MNDRETKLKKAQLEYVNEAIGFFMPLEQHDEKLADIYYLEKHMRAIALNAYYNGYMYAKGERNDLIGENE